MGRIELHPGLTRTEKNKLRRKTFHTYFRSYIYDGIKNRCHHHPKYIGKPYMDRKAWYSFLDDTFIDRVILFNNWTKSGYSFSLAPSIDRIDSTDGYVPENLRWVTLAQNSKNQIPWTTKIQECKKGHPFDISYRGRRLCSICNKQNKRRWYLKWKEVVADLPGESE